MFLPRFPALLPLVLAVLASCDVSPPAGTPSTGALQVALSSTLAAPGDVARVSVTVSGADMTTQTTDLRATEGTWGGVLGAIPAGTGRTVQARAYTASDVLRYQGRADNVTVTAGATGLVILLLQDVTPAGPFTNEAPLLDALVATPTRVAPGHPVSLEARAHDPNAGDTVSYLWSAPSGTFAAPGQPSTTWTAPAPQGPVRLMLRVSDSRGAAFTVGLTLDVSADGGTAEVRVDFNTAPRVVGLASTQSTLDVGQSTTLSASVTDADGDALGYQWSATCPGTFSAATSATTLFTPSALPAQACNNCQLSVAVTDGRGGRNTGGLALCVAPGAVWSTPQHWSLTGALRTARTGHMTTLLPNGQVLVAGGSGMGGRLASAELYDPATGTWRDTRPLLEPREYHTMTLLPTGQVLVVGGYNDGGGLRTAELYDPATGTWRSTGALNSVRYSHAAALLPGGKVLVAGGINGGGTLATAEVYDPALGTWSTTASMAIARSRQTATPLPDGKVLITGGGNGTTAQASSEVYNPATGGWSAPSAMLQVRGGFTATLLPTGKVLVAGGSQGSNALATTELYDPATSTWSSASAMATARLAPSATLLSTGQVLIVGGYNVATWNYHATAELYDPATGTWSSTGTLRSTRRANHAATLLPNGKVLVSGGNNEFASTRVSELYDPAPAF